jgi:GT2 family glycosyltransferase
VAILVVCYNGRAFLHDCLTSLLASNEAPFSLRIVVLDNASTDGSADFVAQNFPAVDLIRLQSNLGFAGGNNAGWEWIRDHYPKTRYLALLNQDTIVHSGWAEELARYLETHPIAGAGQAKLMLHPQTDRFNTAGNVSHFLGFGFTTACGDRDTGQFAKRRRLGLASGAAMMIRADAIDRVGLFDPAFFAYLEDADLSWKLRQLGYELAFIPTSVVEHKYQFKSDWSHYFLLERNRWLLLGTYYKTATLLLLLPALAAMEAGQIYFSWRAGVLREKLRAYGYFFNRKNLRHLLERRKHAQRRRIVGDRQFTHPFVGSADFSELSSPLLRRVANPLFSAYWTMARRLMLW